MQHLSSSEKTALRMQEGKSGYVQVCNREQAVWTSKMRYQVKEFSILCRGRCKALDSLNSFLSYAPQFSRASTISLLILLLASPQLLSNHHGEWQHPLDRSFGSPHSHLETSNNCCCDITCLSTWQEIFSFHIGYFLTGCVWHEWTKINEWKLIECFWPEL